MKVSQPVSVNGNRPSMSKEPDPQVIPKDGSAITVMQGRRKRENFVQRRRVKSRFTGVATVRMSTTCVMAHVSVGSHLCAP